MTARHRPSRRRTCVTYPKLRRGRNYRGAHRMARRVRVVLP